MNLSEGIRLRLAHAWQPEVWVGAVRRAFGPVADVADLAGQEDANTIDSRPAQWLIALWGPQTLHQPFLPRLPFMVQLTSRMHSDAIAELLRHVPAMRLMWLTDSDIDWALMGEIVLLSEPSLRTWQQRELARFIRAERDALAHAISTGYMGRELDEGFTPTQAGAL